MADERETSPETPLARLETWPPRRVDQLVDELERAGASLPDPAISVLMRQLRDATQEGLDACKHLASDLRNEMDAMRIDLKRATEKIFELAQINSLLRDEVHELRGLVKAIEMHGGAK